MGNHHRLLLPLLLLSGAAGLDAARATTTARSQRTTTADGRRKLELLNDSGEPVAVDWISPITGEAFPYWNGRDGEKMFLDSYVNHTFVVRSDARNQSSTFTVTADQPSGTQVVIVKRGLQVERPDPLATATVPTDPDASELVFRCRIAADNALAKGQVATDQVLDDLARCLERRTAEALMIKNEQLAFESQLRKQISHLAENYTCSDPTRETTPPLRETTWTHRGVTRRVGILHDRPSSQIHVLHNFISRDECDAVEKAAKPLLHRGTVADGKGGSRMSENRKAWQAGLKVNWDKEDEGDLIAAVSRRLFDYANHVTGYNMRVDGQEDLMSIQYFGNGTSDPRPDRYTPHCDGDCDGLPHKTGGRVATMVMYCDVPELGGGTNFQNSNVFVKPKAGAAAFFSYMDPTTRLHEEGFTSHSGCPVYQGTKRIAVQWMRVGVDLQNPWDSFDTNTIKKTDYDAADESCGAGGADLREEEAEDEDLDGEFDDDFDDDDED